MSTKGRYGLRAMLQLALKGGTRKPVYLPEIAKEEDISEKYLEQIFSFLVKAGLVKGIRGRYGGYLLARKPSEIKISEILEVLEGSFSVVDCVKDKNYCKKANSCVSKKIWEILSEKIQETLSHFTLQDLCDMQKKIDGEIYYI